jgi:hypothetical protein
MSVEEDFLEASKELILPELQVIKQDLAAVRMNPGSIDQ